MAGEVATRLKRSLAAAAPSPFDRIPGCACGAPAATGLAVGAAAGLALSVAAGLVAAVTGGLAMGETDGREGSGAGLPAGTASVSNTINSDPTGTMSPGPPVVERTRPLTGAGSSTAAFSVITSTMTSS